MPTEDQPAASSFPSAAPVASAPPPAPAPAAPAGSASAKRLVITSGAKEGLELPLSDQPLTIGRSSESGLVIRDDYTSTHHARLMLWGDDWVIQDLDSTNGTYPGRLARHTSDAGPAEHSGQDRHHHLRTSAVARWPPRARVPPSPTSERSAIEQPGLRIRRHDISSSSPTAWADTLAAMSHPPSPSSASSRLDRAYASAHDAEFALQSALLAANSLLAETVFEHAELTGMGTTVSGLLRVGDRDRHRPHRRLPHLPATATVTWSRSPPTTPSCSDSSTAAASPQEEAAVHPRRIRAHARARRHRLRHPRSTPRCSTPEPGDRWLICSDGLSSYVSDDKIETVLASFGTTRDAANRLIKESLDHGAPDNVTVVLVDIGENDEYAGMPPQIVGSAAMPLTFEAEIARRAAAPADPAAASAQGHPARGLPLRAGIRRVSRRAHPRGQAASTAAAGSPGLSPSP